MHRVLVTDTIFRYLHLAGVYFYDVNSWAKHHEIMMRTIQRALVHTTIEYRVSIWRVRFCLVLLIFRREEKRRKSKLLKHIRSDPICE